MKISNLKYSTFNMLLLFLGVTPRKIFYVLVISSFDSASGFGSF